MAPASWALPLAWSRSICLPAAAPGIFHRDIWNPGNKTSGSPTLLISLLSGVSGQTCGWVGQMAKRPDSPRVATLPMALGKTPRGSGISFLLLSQTGLVDNPLK